MATRSKRFVAGLLAGYGSIGANIIFTVASVPLALHYLDKEQFGLWALALQINGYLNLIDLGMSGAVSRHIADHKDDVNGGDYGDNLITGSLVFLIQGLMIALVGIGISWFAPSLFSVPEHLAGQFRLLLMILCATTGAAVAIRGFSVPLWAFQRSDVINAGATVCLLLNLLLLWLALKAGLGYLSLALAPLLGTFGAPLFNGIFCKRSGYYPSKGHWGRPKWSVFKQSFGYGKDVVLIQLGNQLINATQIMIVSRWVGLEAAATLAVATKFYTMAMLFVQNPIAASAPALTELHVRGDLESFKRRYLDVLSLVIAFATAAASCLVTANRSVVALWTHGEIQWTWVGDLLLGLLILFRNFDGNLVSLFGIMKNWRPVRFLYVVEGLVFVPVAILAARAFGLTGVMLASLVVHLAVTTSFSARAAAGILGGLGAVVKRLGVALSVVLSAWLVSGFVEYAGLGFWMATTICCLVAGLALTATWAFVMPFQLKGEVMARLLGLFRFLRRRPT